MSDCLFDAEELEKMEQGRSVNVSNASKKKLSYNQRIFNRLLARFRNGRSEFTKRQKNMIVCLNTTTRKWVN